MAKAIEIISVSNKPIANFVTELCGIKLFLILKCKYNLSLINN